MKISYNKKAFTLVELVVVATILVVLTSLWFYSYVGNLQDSRDSARQADIAKLSSALKLYQQKRWVYPNPWNSFNIVNNGTGVAIQGKLDESVPLSTLDSLAYDPKIQIPYTYAITANKQEFQVAGTLENSDNPRAIMEWDYKTVSINILPTILLATDSTVNMEIADGVWDWSQNRRLFIFNGWTHNIPYSFDDGYPAVSDATLFNDLINDPLIKFWQNSDYRSCADIREAGKSIWDGEYQVRDDTWTLSWELCTGM